MSDNVRNVELLVCIGDAAKALGLKYWKLQRAVKDGLVPSYSPFNGRRLVRISEVIAAIEKTRSGGGGDDE